MSRAISLYFTSNQDWTREKLEVEENPFKLIKNWGMRLREAMGDKEILSRNNWMGGEFRPPTFRAYCEALDRSPWTCHGEERSLFVVPYNSIYDGWKANHGFRRSGIMCRCVNSYEFAYELWDEWTHWYHPDLLDNGTFGVWLELLPEPASVVLKGKYARIEWNDSEPRVHRSAEMGRYSLSKADCFAETMESSWRISRAEAYVRAWEKMANNEPKDRYESKIAEDQERLRKRWAQ